MSQRLAGKTCLVTGAAHGMGCAMVDAFRAEGAPVIATDLDVGPLCGLPDGIEVVQLDVTSAEDASRAALVERQPLGRMGQAAEVAAVAVMLASDESSFMTGADVIVDAGISLSAVR